MPVNPAQIAKNILDIEGIVGVGSSRTVKIFVESEDYVDAVPQSLGGERVEVIVTGRLYAQRLHGGISIGPKGIPSAGTLGVITPEGYLLSNAHVLAMDINNHYLKHAYIVSPGEADGGGPVIGELVGYTYIKLNDTTADNYVDLAVAKVTVPYEPLEVDGYRVSLEPVEVKEGDLVRKFGRTTGLTYARVVSTSATLKIWYGKDFAVFVDAIVVKGAGGPFSKAGDSGAFVDKGGKFAGLLFAGNPETGYSVLNKPQYVLEAYNYLTKKQVPQAEVKASWLPALAFMVPVAAVMVASVRRA